MFKKQTNADELEIAGEMCLAVAMTKPVICLLCIIQVATKHCALNVAVNPYLIEGRLLSNPNVDFPRFAVLRPIPSPQLKFPLIDKDLECCGSGGGGPF